MSSFRYFSKNGVILPESDATISLFNLEYSYGYGVYETLKVRKGILYFVDQHLERLEHSASVIEVTLPFTKEQIKHFLTEIVTTLAIEACNIKILLIGGDTTNLFIFASAPLFPDRKYYKNGAHLLTYQYERIFPTAKTLNMLSSYIAYQKAKKNNCYDALFIDPKQIILEGTRTNFCLIKGTTIFKAPEKRILGGVTFLTLAKVAEKEGFTIVEKEIPLKNIHEYDGAFISSTSTKIMPIIKINEFTFPTILSSIKQLMTAYDTFLEQSNGVL